MIANILVPLDGSARGEQVLPFAETIARAARARLWLVHARPAMTPLIDPEHGFDAAARGEGIAAHLREVGLKATARTVHGDATNVILDASIDMPADLIVMSTHGQGGIGRWLYGSVTDQVLARTGVPVLLVSSVCEHPWPEGRRLKILVPLDGSDSSEAALGPARMLSRAIGGDLLLVRVVEQPADAAWMLDAIGAPKPRAASEALDEAQTYLDGIAAPPGGTSAPYDVLVEEGDPASAIARIARQGGIDLIVMAAHGRTGLARLTLGSVATATLQRAHVPVLLVRPPAMVRPSVMRSADAELLNVWPPIGTR